MGFWRKDTHIDTVRELITAALKKAQKEVRWELSHYSGTEPYTVLDHTSSVGTSIENSNRDLAIELRKIADLLESREIYKYYKP